MAQTLCEKIIAKAAGTGTVSPGEIVTCKVDLAMMHDSAGPRMAGKKLDELGVPVWDLDKLVVITDHYINDDNPAHHAIQKHAFDSVKHHDIRHCIQEQGICHIVLPQAGHVKPGMFIVGGDSHSVTGGAFGAFMVGIGATEMTGDLATGAIWLRVLETVKIDVTGTLKPGVAAKDVILKLCGEHGIMGFNYQAIEYGGSAVSAMVSAVSATGSAVSATTSSPARLATTAKTSARSWSSSVTASAAICPISSGVRGTVEPSCSGCPCAARPPSTSRTGAPRFAAMRAL